MSGGSPLSAYKSDHSDRRSGSLLSCIIVAGCGAHFLCEGLVNPRPMRGLRSTQQKRIRRGDGGCWRDSFGDGGPEMRWCSDPSASKVSLATRGHLRIPPDLDSPADSHDTIIWSATRLPTSAPAMLPLDLSAAAAREKGSGSGRSAQSPPVEFPPFPFQLYFLAVISLVCTLGSCIEQSTFPYISFSFLRKQLGEGLAWHLSC